MTFIFIEVIRESPLHLGWVRRICVSPALNLFYADSGNEFVVEVTDFSSDADFSVKLCIFYITVFKVFQQIKNPQTSPRRSHLSPDPRRNDLSFWPSSNRKAD